MAGRASWKGYLKLSLVSCPVKLYPATSSSAGKISFNLLHKDTLNRVQQKYHDPELGEIDRADLVKGYQFEKDKYVVVTSEELDEIEIESSKTIDIDGFVDQGDVDRSISTPPTTWPPTARSPRRPSASSSRRCARPARWRWRGSSCRAASAW